MLFDTVTRYIESFRRARDTSDYLLRAEHFQSVLARECGRADRNNHGFSLVIMRLDSHRCLRRQNCRLFEILGARMRHFDIAGWIDDVRVGVILPETPQKGAEVFIKNVQDTLKASGHPEFPVQISEYPRPEKRNAQAGTVIDLAPAVSSGAMADDALADEALAARGAWVVDGEPATCSTLTLEEKPRKSEGDFRSIQDVRALFVPAMPVWKRTLDLIGSSLGLLFLAPLFAMVAVWIKMVSPGPVFFRQERIGYLGRSFTMWKFRTMHVNNDPEAHKRYLAELIAAGDGEDKPMIKQENNPSIIPLGRIIRAASVDELPQLINVLLGEMSLVGPRPPIPYEADEYLRWHSNRFDTVPGMTGLWQVSGKNQLTFKQMVRLDIQYCRRLTLGRDLWILLMTGPAVVSLALDGLLRKNNKEACDVSKEAA